MEAAPQRRRNVGEVKRYGRVEGQKSTRAEMENGTVYVSVGIACATTKAIGVENHVSKVHHILCLRSSVRSRSPRLNCPLLRAGTEEDGERLTDQRNANSIPALIFSCRLAAAHACPDGCGYVPSQRTECVTAPPSAYISLYVVWKGRGRARPPRHSRIGNHKLDVGRRSATWKLEVS